MVIEEILNFWIPPAQRSLSWNRQ